MSTRRYTVFARQGEPTSPTRPDSPTLPIFVSSAPAHSNPMSIVTNYSHAQAEIVSPTHTATDALSRFPVTKTEKAVVPHPHPLHSNPPYPQTSRPQIQLDIHVGPDAAATLREARRTLIQQLRIKACTQIDPDRLRTNPTRHDLRLASTSMAMLDRVRTDGRLTSNSGSVIYEIPTRDVAAENAHRRAGITRDPEARVLQRASVRRAPVFCMDAQVDALGNLRYKQYRQLERAMIIQERLDQLSRAGAGRSRPLVRNPDLAVSPDSGEDEIDPHLEQMWPIATSDEEEPGSKASIKNVQHRPQTSLSSSSTEPAPQEIRLPLTYNSSSSSSNEHTTHKQQAYTPTSRTPPTKPQKAPPKLSQERSNTPRTTNSSSIRTCTTTTFSRSSSDDALRHRSSSNMNPIIMAAEFAKYEEDSDEDEEEED